VIALVQATFPDLPTAERLAQQVIDEHLAACANLWPCQSVYRWRGAVQRGSEVVGQFKTSFGQVEALVARLGALHPYDQPAIEWWRAEADEAVQQWIGPEVS
jgi:periplasmic divalent cation tolerance protein